VIYVHPVLGAVSIALLVWIGLQGLRGAHATRYAPAARQRHTRWVPWIYAAIFASWVTGVVSALWLRADLSLAGSWHFWLGLATVVLLGLNASIWWMKNRELAAGLHRWIGLIALGLAAVQGSLGLGLLP